MRKISVRRHTSKISGVRKKLNKRCPTKISIRNIFIGLFFIFFYFYEIQTDELAPSYIEIFLKIELNTKTTQNF